MKNKYFIRYLKIAPFALALWRGVESQAIAEAYLKLPSTIRKKDPQNPLAFKRPLLDIGCGFGEFAGVFFESQVEMGLDINSDDLLRAEKANKYKKLICADARNLPFPDHMFSTIISMSVLEHIPQTERAIKEAYRVLKPGGLFIFSVPTTLLNDQLFYSVLFRKLKLSRVANWYVKHFHKAFKHVSLYSPEKWRAITKSAGFYILSVNGTITPLQVKFFDLTLIIALPSQILRHLFGSRFVWGLALKKPFLTPLFNWLNRPEKVYEGNIVIVAKK